MIIDNTPIETYEVQGQKVYVKREDLCAPEGAPTFSKIRGLIPHLQHLKECGFCTVGYTETSVSMAGWGVAWAGEQLGLKTVIFDPQYKNTPPLLHYHRKQWSKFSNVVLIPIKAGMAKVNWNISKNILREQYGDKAILLPLGLPLDESVEATACEASNTLNELDFKTVVINVGSGTMTAGIWKGLDKKQGLMYGIMGRTGSVYNKLNTIQKKSGKLNSGLFSSNWKLKLVNPGWEYTQMSKYPCPFPCHPYYDRKAWQWLCENINQLEPPILFWNIGS